MKIRMELTEAEWKSIEKILPPERGRRGRPAKCNRTMVNAIIWIMRTGSPWRDLPECYGPWKSVYTRFSRWSSQGVWEKIFNAVSVSPDDEYHMIDSTFVRAHQHAAGAKGGNSTKNSGVQGADLQRKSMP